MIISILNSNYKDKIIVMFLNFWISNKKRFDNLKTNLSSQVQGVTTVKVIIVVLYTRQILLLYFRNVLET